MLKPAGLRVSAILRVRRRAAIVVRSRSSSEISIRSAEWVRGITRAWPGVNGLMSMNESVCSSESTIWAGASPATIAQKMQSSVIGREPYAFRARRARIGHRSGGSRMKASLGVVLSLVALAATAQQAVAAKPRVSVGDVTVAESAGSAAVPISLSKKAKGTVKVTLATADRTAQALVDY